MNEVKLIGMKRKEDSEGSQVGSQGSQAASEQKKENKSRAGSVGD